MINGKYIGPPKPGPWAYLFTKMGVDVFTLGPLFILFGAAWLMWVLICWGNQPAAYGFGILLSICTLWYLPVGTLFAAIILAVLIFARGKVGM